MRSLISVSTYFLRVFTVLYNTSTSDVSEVHLEGPFIMSGERTTHVTQNDLD